MFQAASHRAACKGHDPELWFPVSESNAMHPVIEVAKSICRRCPLQDACLADALDNRTEFGIWGGTTPNERRWMLREGRGLSGGKISADQRGRTALVRQMADPPK